MKKTSSNSDSPNAAILASLPILPGQLSTDVFYGMSFARLDSDTVISRSSSGQILSRLKDDIWILENYQYSVVDNPKFDLFPFQQECEHRFSNAETCKKILLIKMFAPNLRTGKPLRLGTVHAIRYLLIRMAEYCAAKNIQVVDVFQTLSRLQDFQSCKKVKTNNLSGLIRTLSKLKFDDRGFSIDGHILPYLKKSRQKAKNSAQQVPIIPSRILLLKYKQYHSHLDEFAKNYNNIRSFLDLAAGNPFYARGNATGSKAKALMDSKHTFELVSFNQSIDDNNLGELREKYQWSMISNVISFVTDVSHCAKNLIHLYTLMRNHEVKSISHNCLTPIRGWNNDALYVAGISTKVYSSRQPRKWITTDAILKPIETLKKISTILSPFIQNPEDYLLLSLAAHPASSVKAAKNNIVTNSELDLRLAPVLITEEDIQELETIEPLRDWRNDRRFMVGKRWITTSHQFRRTMTIFCSQTGLITLPSLKRLLGHLTKIMTLYYTKGCSAQNYTFSLINPQLAKEFSEAKAEADGAMFIREALQTTERLYGLKGSEINSQRSSPTWLHREVSQTVKLAKLGLVAYTESPLGGCASPAPCDKRAHGNYYSCPGCRHLIAKESVLNDSQAIMEFDLAELNPDSLEYKAEKQNLEDFIELRNKIIAKFS